MENYFKQLEKYNEEKKEEIIEDCCNNKKIIIDEPKNIEICKSCGNTEIYIELIQDNYITQTNPKYRLTSIIPYSFKYKHLNRIQKWNNYSYKENTALKSYKTIRNLGLEFNLNNEIINNAIQLYKKFYYQDKISTRNKIKRSLFIYCLFYFSFNNNFFDIFEKLKIKNLSVTHFNKAISRSNLNEYFLQVNMKKYIQLIEKKYKKFFELKQVIIKYNELLKKNDKFNTNSILILVFYRLLNITNENDEFFNLFDISKFTLKKIIKN